MLAVGFLDDLKRQADAARAAQTIDTAALERNTALADAACKTVFSYFNTLGQQLQVLKPVSKVRYTLDKRTVFDALPMLAFRTDARRKHLRGAEVFDHVVMQCQLRTEQRIHLVKDFLPDIEKLESRLRQSGVRFDAEAVRNPENNKLLEMRYTLPVDFTLAVRAVPDHDAGWIRFQLNNLDGFETVNVDFPATEVGSARLDELARWLVGEPHRFLDDGHNLRRVEA